MKYEFVSEPCRNFCIFATTVIIDPKDGKEKFVLSNFSDGGTGSLIIIDPENDEHETITLPEDEGAWAIINYKNEKLIVGTCSKFGYIHALDLQRRKWLSSVRDPNELYVWNFTLGSDGMIYGGTWPGCALLQYDPENLTVSNMGKMSDYSTDMYCRIVFGTVPGYIVASCGCDVQHIVLWEIATGKKIMLGKAGSIVKEITADTICLQTENNLEYYSTVDFQLARSTPVASKENCNQWTDNGVKCVVSLGNGKTAGIRGQEYFITNDMNSVPQFKRIPGEAPPTTIMTIIAGKDGNIWGSTALGQTIFRYHPSTREYWNSPQVCNNSGEVYGMRLVNDKLYMSAYCGGDHIVYDPSQPWDQFNNMNPATLPSVLPELIRPTGKSVVGPDGNFWTGWSAKYGIYGGGLSCIDVNTNEMRCWYDPVPTQQIAGLASDGNFIYFTTNGEASGNEAKVEPFSLCVWDVKGRIAWKHVFESNVNLGVVEIVGNHLLVSANESILVYETNTMNLLKKMEMGAVCTCMLMINELQAAAFCGDSLYFIDPENGTVQKISEVPGRVETAAIDVDGVLTFASNCRLYRLTSA